MHPCHLTHTSRKKACEACRAQTQLLHTTHAPVHSTPTRLTQLAHSYYLDLVKGAQAALRVHFSGCTGTTSTVATVSTSTVPTTTAQYAPIPTTSPKTSPRTSPKTSPQLVPCHQCKKKKVLDVQVVCTNMLAPRPSKSVSQSPHRGSSPRRRQCRKKYCMKCLRTRYHLDLVTCRMNPNWVCPACQDICDCGDCRKKRERAQASGASSSTIPPFSTPPVQLAIPPSPLPLPPPPPPHCQFHNGQLVAARLGSLSSFFPAQFLEESGVPPTHYRVMFLDDNLSVTVRACNVQPYEKLQETPQLQRLLPTHRHDGHWFRPPPGNPRDSCSPGTPPHSPAAPLVRPIPRLPPTNFY
eukprot:TRINITY_DN1557_c0_g1_i1.p1 TRINITY_DN1557_c0_g1~~TRINITY_DN1557_c0_g1_i1.p1  ORF type:complete len:354 (+),score=67.31 TRINITY_DN1557_c0_g1_i1:1134-2195(+)